MAPHSINPARIQNAAANHLHQLFLQGPNSRPLRCARISMIAGRGFSTEVPHRGMQAALKLEVVVRIEDIVFTVILVLMNHLDFRESRSEQIELFSGHSLAIKGKTSPF